MVVIRNAYLQVRQQAQIGRELVRGCAKAGEGREDVDVDLARVRLGRDGVRVPEAGELGDAAVELLDLIVVPVEQGEEARLGARRALDAPEAEVVPRTLDVAQIPEKLLFAERIRERH